MKMGCGDPMPPQPWNNQPTMRDVRFRRKSASARQTTPQISRMV
jgi:hypothetical protein